MSSDSKSKLKILFGIILILFFVAANALALAPETHRAINESIASGVFLNEYLQKQLGLQEGIKTKYNDRQVLKLISDGGEAEDSGARSLNHFHNPLTDAGLSSNYSALTWATMPIGVQYYAPISSWNDVRSYYYQALTVKDKTARESWFAMTFQGVGQIMHLVQDMSIPAHSRGDMHPLGNDYENWGKKNIKDVTQVVSYSNYSNYTPFNNLLFLIPQLFDTDQYVGTNPLITLSNNIGLAEYTNANFLSSGTIFKGFTYPAYKPGVTLTENIENKILYLKKTGDGQTIDYFARAGRFYPKLPANYKSLGLMVNDNKVHENYARLLIPRAISYSAEVLKYFFRGKTNMRRTSLSDSDYVIENNSSEAMEGEFHLYYDNTSDARVEIKNGNFPITAMKIGAKTSSDSINFTTPTDAKTPGEYMLVFRGKFGEETGAVEGNIVKTSTPYSFIFTLNRGDGTLITDNSAYYTLIRVYAGSTGQIVTDTIITFVDNKWHIKLPGVDKDPLGYWVTYWCMDSIHTQYPGKYKVSDKLKTADLIQPGEYSDTIPYWKVDFATYSPELTPTSIFFNEDADGAWHSPPTGEFSEHPDLGYLFVNSGRVCSRIRSSIPWRATYSASFGDARCYASGRQYDTDPKNMFMDGPSGFGYVNKFPGAHTIISDDGSLSLSGVVGAEPAFGQATGNWRNENDATVYVEMARQTASSFTGRCNKLVDGKTVSVPDEWPYACYSLNIGVSIRFSYED